MLFRPRHPYTGIYKLYTFTSQVGWFCTFWYYHVFTFNSTCTLLLGRGSHSMQNRVSLSSGLNGMYLKPCTGQVIIPLEGPACLANNYLFRPLHTDRSAHLSKFQQKISKVDGGSGAGCELASDPYRAVACCDCGIRGDPPPYSVTLHPAPNLEKKMLNELQTNPRAPISNGMHWTSTHWMPMLLIPIQSLPVQDVTL